MNFRQYFPNINFITGINLLINSYLNNYIQGKSYTDIIKVSHKISSQAYFRHTNIVPKEGKIIDLKEGKIINSKVDRIINSKRDKIINPKKDKIIILNQNNSLIILVNQQIVISFNAAFLLQVFNLLVNIAFIHLLNLLEETSPFKASLFFVFLYLVFILVSHLHHHLCNHFLLLEYFILKTIDIKDLQCFLLYHFHRKNHHQLQIASLTHHSRILLLYLLHSFLHHNNIDHFYFYCTSRFMIYDIIYFIFNHYFYYLSANKFTFSKSIQLIFIF